MNDRCPRCDRPIATDADWTTTPSGEGGHLCWGGACPAVDWRKRALVAEAERDALRAAIDAQAVPLGEAQRLHDHVETALRRHVKAITQEALDAPEVSCG
mgnify:CR=1 FL=1